VIAAQDKNLAPKLNDWVGFGKPASTPPLTEMWEIWRAVTAEADIYLNNVTPKLLQTHFDWQGKPYPESAGTLLYRNMFHYWFHIGEAHAVRQMLGHLDLPQFVGDMTNAIYQPEI
jgi:hypothetical protein